MTRCHLLAANCRLVSNNGIGDLTPVAFRPAAAVVKSHAAGHFLRTEVSNRISWLGAHLGHPFAEGLAARASLLLNATHFGPRPVAGCESELLERCGYAAASWSSG